MSLSCWPPLLPIAFSGTHLRLGHSGSSVTEKIFKGILTHLHLADWRGSMIPSHYHNSAYIRTQHYDMGDLFPLQQTVDTLYTTLYPPQSDKVSKKEKSQCSLIACHKSKVLHWASGPAVFFKKKQL